MTYSDVVERFMRYVQVDSQSDPDNEAEVPSTPRQHNMARMLVDDLLELGCVDAKADEHAYVTATVPASAGAEKLPALCLCAHIDSTPDAPGAGVRPHVVSYEGGDLISGVVNGEPVATSPEQLPDLKKLVGQDIICSDGTTLLSADDKAGVAEIVSLVARLMTHPELPHPTLKLAFVPDEEIGHGASLLDLDALGARWGYTVDGGPLGEFSYECFNGSSAVVSVKGVGVHPGTAKDVMINAITVASEFQQLIPAAERPEHADGREGFYHPIGIKGDSTEVTLSYILRDFDTEGLRRRGRTLADAASFLNARYGEGTVTVKIRQQYRNMAAYLAGQSFLVQNALDANRETGIEPYVIPVRGGTDGAQLTFRGLPCPNLATGGYNYHSVREFIPVRGLELMVDVLERLVAKFAVEQEQA